jgi:signal transduction histidine kinase
MSHEIRTPLNAISGFSGLLSKNNLSDEKRTGFISIIQNSSKQLISIVNDILTISSLETNQLKPVIEKVSINEIIIELFEIFKQQAQNSNISIHKQINLTNEQSVIYTDKTKIIQILSNLISNAFKFTNKGSIEFGYTYSNIIENNTSKNGFLRFYVKDTGIGIQPYVQEKIFERFRQADNSIAKKYGGTGLGLSISKAFVELLGGKIWLESQPDIGSTFFFTIPYKPVN